MVRFQAYAYEKVMYYPGLMESILAQFFDFMLGYHGYGHRFNALSMVMEKKLQAMSV